MFFSSTRSAAARVFAQRAPAPAAPSMPAAAAVAAASSSSSSFARTRRLHAGRGTVGKTKGNAARVYPRLPRASPSVPTSADREWPNYGIPEDAARFVYDLDSTPGGPVTVAWTDGFLFVQDSAERGPRVLKPTTLRDSCECPRCRNPASGQKTFASTEIPTDIGIADVRAASEGLAITFSKDVARLARYGAGHEMVLPWTSVEMALKRRGIGQLPVPRRPAVLRRTGVQYWDAETLGRHVRRIDYADYMQGGTAFWDAVVDLCRLGIVFLENVPRDEEAVVGITTRIANIRETFYGRTFDVRAKPDAENVAYTNGHLGLHQDLMYLDTPPMIQVLHCMDMACAGGESLFSDGERVGRLLWPFAERSARLAPLLNHHVPYAYAKHGHRYFASRFVIDRYDASSPGFAAVNWSPPFQGTYLSAAKDLRPWIAAARVFERLVNDDAAVFSAKMGPGDCVLFDNLRVMHGRTAFDAASAGARWLRGAYIAPDDFLSRAVHIPAGQAEAYRGPVEWTAERAQAELQASPWLDEVRDMVRELDPRAADSDLDLVGHTAMRQPARAGAAWAEPQQRS